MTKNWDIFPRAEPSGEALANFSAYHIYNKSSFGGYGVLTGCVTSRNSSSRVDITLGTYTNNGAPRNLSASYVDSIPAASAGNHRYDLIYIDGADDTVKRCAGTEGVPASLDDFLENYDVRPAEPTDTDWIPLAIIRVTENGIENLNFGTNNYATGSVVCIRASQPFVVDDTTLQVIGGVISIKSALGTTKLDDLAAPDDNTDLNTSISAHGLCPKLSNSATQFLNGQGNFSTPTIISDWEDESAESWVYFDSNTIQVAGDKTLKYFSNQLIKITQSGTVRYFVITSVVLVSGNTRLTVNGCGLYTLVSDVISSPYMTVSSTTLGIPYDFPHLSIVKTLSNTTGTVYGKRAIITSLPSSVPSSLGIFGQGIETSNAVGNTDTFASIVSGIFSTTLRAGATTNALDGLLVNADCMGYSAAIKGAWANANNYGRNAGFTYALEASANNFAYGGIGVGNTDLITSVRARIQNYVNNTASGGASGPANATIARLIAANIINEKSGSGNGNYNATIGTASQLECDLSNIGGIITNHYYIKLNAPVNSGTLTNHWGIYLADQTVAGTTVNYAIYSVGGKVYFGGEVITPHPIVAPCISVAPDGTVFCIGSDKALHIWGTGWTSLGGVCRSVAAISATEAYVIGDDENVWKWTSPSTWTQITTAIP